MGNGTRPVLVALAIVGGLALFAVVSRSFWYMVVGGGPLVVAVVVVCSFLLGLVLGGFLRR